MMTSGNEIDFFTQYSHRRQSVQPDEGYRTVSEFMRTQQPHDDEDANMDFEPIKPQLPPDRPFMASAEISGQLAKAVPMGENFPVATKESLQALHGIAAATAENEDANAVLLANAQTRNSTNQRGREREKNF